MKIIDEIINILEIEAEENKYAYITPHVLKKFASIKKQKESTPNYVQKMKQPNNYSELNWEQLEKIVKICTKCELCKNRTNVVFGEGNSSAELMIIGEGPGRDEDEQGRPFVGKSGQLLTKMLNAMGFARSDVFIANIVKCRPPNNRNPEPEEAKSCLPFLLRQIELIHPKILLLLGAVPLKFLLNRTGITKIHGEWLEFMGIKTLPSFHPAFLLRDPRQKKLAWEDLQKVMQALGKKI